MKTIKTTKTVQKLEAPIALTPDQIAMVAAGMVSKGGEGGTTTSGAQSTIAHNSSLKVEF